MVHDLGPQADASMVVDIGDRLLDVDEAEHQDAASEQDVGVRDSGFDADRQIPDSGQTKMRHPFDHLLSIEHIQMRGTHNSYHVQPRVPIHDSHRYSHVSLDRQLEEQGVRAFELDVHQGLLNGDLSVYHIAVVDDQSTCSRFVDCLADIKTWSDTNRVHVPIVIWIEPKDESGGAIFSDLEQFDLDIRSVFPPEQLLTPDDVQGGHASLRVALETVGWPKLAQSRGRVIFMLLQSSGLRDAYMRNTGDLSGRVMFPHADLTEFSQPWAAVSKINNPRDQAAISAAQAAHILVASNLCLADADDAECEDKRRAGLENGVQMLKDDFPGMVSSRMYWLDIPDGQPVRCDPETAPPECTSLALEDLP
jgi:hypothetical protein